MTTIKLIEKKIEIVKKKLMELGDMHPGSLSKQYNICGTPNCKCKDPENPKKHGPYYNLSFVCYGRSTTRFIKPEFVNDVNKQLQNYKEFKRLTNDWKNLAAELAKMKIDAIKNKTKG